MGRFGRYARQHHWGMLATVLVLAGGTAYAAGTPSTQRAGSDACPRKMVRTVGICVEKKPRESSQHLFTDQEKCAAKGRRLLSFGELRAALLIGKIGPVPTATHSGGSGEWTSDIFHEGSTQTWIISDGGLVTTTDAGQSGWGATWFRCAIG